MKNKAVEHVDVSNVNRPPDPSFLHSHPPGNVVLNQRCFEKKKCNHHEQSCVKSSVLSIGQRLLVQQNLLSRFERWHSCIWTAGTSERITQVTLPQY